LKLKVLLGIKNEICDVLKPFHSQFSIELFTTKEALRQKLQTESELYKIGLLIAATDETIALGEELEIATLAYANPDIPAQSYRGVEMLVEGFEEVDRDFLEKVFQRYHHIPWTILETERCILRELSLADMDELFALYEGEGIGKFTETLYPYEEEKEFQRAYINNMYRFFGYGMWLIFSKETGKMIGRAGLEHREYHEKIELELGYLIGTQYQRQGYAEEVCKAILDYAKENTSFERINCVIAKENLPSIRLAEKLGFYHAEDYDLNKKIMHRFMRELV